MNVEIKEPVSLDPTRVLIGYIARHGETALNAANCWRGWENPPLDENGIMAAERLGYWLQFEGIGRVVCSDFDRAVHTAEIIMQIANPKCTFLGTDANLRPWHIGEFAGEEKTPERIALLRKYINSPNLVIPNGESLNQFRDRNDIVIFQYLAVPYDGRPTVVVAHTSNIVAAMRHVAEVNNEKYEEVDDIVGPGGLVAVYCNSAGRIDIVPVLGVEYINTPEAS